MIVNIIFTKGRGSFLAPFPLMVPWARRGENDMSWANIQVNFAGENSI